MSVAVDDAPNVFRFDWHVEMRYAERRQGIDNRAHNRRCCADRSGFTDTFNSEWIDGRWCLRSIEFHPRNLRSARDRVVHQRAGYQLALLVINNFFKHRLAQRLNNPTVNLPVNEHWIDHLAAVVDSDVAKEIYIAGVTINFNAY